MARGTRYQWGREGRLSCGSDCAEGGVSCAVKPELFSVELSAKNTKYMSSEFVFRPTWYLNAMITKRQARLNKPLIT